MSHGPRTFLTRTFDAASLTDLAARRCGISTPSLTPEQMKILLDNLQLFLYELGNRGLNLWCFEELLVGFSALKSRYPLPVETIDVKMVNLRSPLSRLDSTVTSSTGGVTTALVDDDLTTSFVQGAPGGNLVFDFTEARAVRDIGLLPSVSASYTLELATSGDGLTWSVLSLRSAEDYVAGTWKWIKLSAPVSARYFRVRETGTATLGFYEVHLAEEVSEIPMAPLNRNQYIELPNKTFQGRPLQYWLDRQIVPELVLWPVPGTSERYSSASVWRHRHIQDIGELVHEIEVPVRWYEAVSWELASRVLIELPGADLGRAAMIEDARRKHSMEAEDEERGGGPFIVMPNLRGYTR